MGGLGDWYFYEIALWMHAGIIRRHAFRNRLKCHLLQSNRYGFRNHLKCHFLQIELNNSFLHMLHEWIKVSLIPVSRWVEDIQVLWAP